jgi:pimeloyl-ACP methyl ester carboxylesterase
VFLSFRPFCDIGGKLPLPKPMNDLFREFTGPVLIAQGALDPLNDAKGRAMQFERIRNGITIDLLELGHCPMDENPGLVASSIFKWIKLSSSLQSDS